FQEGADAWVGRSAGKGIADPQILPRPSAVIVLAEVDQVQLLADGAPREVDHNVVAFGDPLLVQCGQRDWVRQQVSVIGDLPYLLRRARRVRQRDLEEARDGGV